MQSILLVSLVALFISIANAGEERDQYNCVHGDCLDGKGKLESRDGRTSMEGQFWNGTLVTGKAVYPNGDVFEGVFQEGFLVQGTKIFKSGETLKGSFTNNVLISGTITYKDGRTLPVRLGTRSQTIPIPKAALPGGGR